MRYQLEAALALGLLAAGAIGATAAGQRAATGPSRATSAAEGGVLFRTYCASCHGQGGMGDGPAAEALRPRPANLTLFAIGNAEVFPAERLRRIVDGRGVVAHGKADMPVWGNAFKNTPDGLTEQMVHARIDAIVAFIESIQARRGE